MELNAQAIGVFGVNLSAGFDQTWATFWRKDEHFSIDYFAMVGDEDPVQDELHVSIEEGEAAIQAAIQNAGIEQWAEQYDASAADTVAGLVWTLDVDDLDQNDIVLYSGNEGVPTRASFDALIEAVRLAVPGFAAGMECFEA